MSEHRIISEVWVHDSLDASAVMERLLPSKIFHDNPLSCEESTECAAMQGYTVEIILTPIQDN